MLTSFTSTSGRTFSQLPSSNSFSKALSFDLGVPTKYCPSLWRRIWRFSSLTIPRSNTHTRRAFPILALNHTQDRLKRRHVRTVSVKHLITARKPLAIDYQRDNKLLSIRPVVS